MSFFITFEGGEGSGKTTQSHMLFEKLLSKDYKVIHTREMGGTQEAEKIRDIMLHSDILPISELFLVMAARYEHISKLILPSLEAGQMVICDRFVDSTACYQGQHEEIGMDLVYNLHKEIIGNLMPDITFFIDLPPTVALPRTFGRNDNNKFEDRNLKFHQKVYEGFQSLAQRFPERIITIKAENLNPEEVHKKIIDIVLDKIIS